MHIGRAHTVPPEELRELAHQAQQRAITELQQMAPATVSRAAAPTGETSVNLPTYNPVIDLIHRLPQADPSAANHVPTQPPAEVYAGTPPTPSVVDLSA